MIADSALPSSAIGPLDDEWLVHEDEALLVLDKPAGLLSVPGRGPDKADCLSARARQRWPDALVVHRLDQATSGLLLLARGAAMQRALSAAFAEPSGNELPIDVSDDLGRMLHDLAYAPDRSGRATPLWFPARLERGILRVPLLAQEA